MSNMSNVARDASKEAKRAVGDMTQATSNAATKAKADVEGVLSEAAGAVREVGDHMVGAIDESLKNRPYTTLTLAVGIGFLLGAIWRR